MSLLKSIGRCDGVGGKLSARQFLFRNWTEDPLSLSKRLDTSLHRGESVEDWLAIHHWIGDAIQWECAATVSGRNVPVRMEYAAWPREDKERLQGLVDLYAGCGMTDLVDPPVNTTPLDDDDYPRQTYAGDAAKSWFLAHIAHTLTVEMGRWVPWSLNDYDAACLANLLDSRSLFRKYPDADTYEITSTVHAPVVPARPRFTYEFLYKNDLIGNDRLDTIARVLDWCRWNLGHYGGGVTTSYMEIYWQYRGHPPVRTMIEGDPVEETHWSFCHATVGFLRSVLRAVNIPVRYVQRCDHGMPHFMHQDLYLSHGDDLYTADAKRKDLPVENLLIDADTFYLWFDSPWSDCANIGRGVDEAVADLPPLDPEG